MEELICFCFNYTFSDIVSDIKENGKSTIEERIVSEKKSGGCMCETKNPKGKWCLADVHRAVDTIMKKEGISKKLSIPFMQSWMISQMWKTENHTDLSEEDLLQAIKKQDSMGGIGLSGLYSVSSLSCFSDSNVTRGVVTHNTRK